MVRSEAMFLINALDSQHAGAQPVLRALVRGENQNQVMKALSTLDSRYARLVPIITAIIAGQGELVRPLITAIDSRSAVLRPLFEALVAGLEPELNEPGDAGWIY